MSELKRGRPVKVHATAEEQAQGTAMVQKQLGEMRAAGVAFDIIFDLGPVVAVTMHTELGPMEGMIDPLGLVNRALSPEGTVH